MGLGVVADVSEIAAPARAAFSFGRPSAVPAVHHAVPCLASRGDLVCSPVGRFAIQSATVARRQYLRPLMTQSGFGKPRFRLHRQRVISEIPPSIPRRISALWIKSSGEDWETR